MDPGDLQHFVVVAREGGFTAAARVLGLSKQSLSERVLRLERQLGVKLLERTTRGVRPTDAGGRLLERGRLVASLLDEAEREARASSVAPTGTLRVTCPTVFGRRVLVPVLSTLRARHPELRVEVALTDREVRLVEEGFDVAIRVGPLPDSSLRARTVGRTSLHVVAARALSPRPRTVSQLRDAPTIATRRGETWRLGARRIELRPVLVLDDLEAAAEAVALGLGIARLPWPMVKRGVESRALVELFPRLAPPPVPVHAVMPPGPYLPARVRVFVDAVAEALRRDAR